MQFRFSNVFIQYRTRTPIDVLQKNYLLPDNVYAEILHSQLDFHKN